LISGARLKELRSRLGVTTREVAEQSARIAERERNPEYGISHAWLAELESNGGNPSIYKLFSLSVIYRTKFTDLLPLFGIDEDKISQYQVTSPSQDTRLVEFEQDENKLVSFPVRFDPGFSVRTTSLVSRMVEVWGEIPISMIQHLDLRRHNYGYIGLEDFTLYPMLRPGSFVQIDPRVTRYQPSKGRIEFDRPIYFLELRNGYACGWCEMQNDTLLLLPHPLSPCSVRQFVYEADAEIVGQVTGVAMRIVDLSPTAESGNAKALKPQ